MCEGVLTKLHTKWLISFLFCIFWVNSLVGVDWKDELTICILKKLHFAHINYHWLFNLHPMVVMVRLSWSEDVYLKKNKNCMIIWHFLFVHLLSTMENKYSFSPLSLGGMWLRYTTELGGVVCLGWVFQRTLW